MLFVEENPTIVSELSTSPHRMESSNTAPRQFIVIAVQSKFRIFF